MARKDLISFEIATNKQYNPNWHHEETAKALEEIEREKLRFLMIFQPPRHGKQVSDNTPILTSIGWKYHGDLKIGDKVFGINGNNIEVIAKSEKTIATIEVELSNGEKIKCHENHEWIVWDRSYNAWKTYETKYLTKPIIGKEKRCRYLLPFYKPLEFEKKELKIDPYILGVWLGDGSSNKPCVTYAINDYQPIDYIKKIYPISATWVHKITGVLTTNFAKDGKPGIPCSFRKDLKSYNLLNNKHIPDNYKSSSIEQRLKLLAGLIDTDGYVDKNSRIIITTVSLKLAKDVEEITFSLGFNPYVEEVRPILSSSGIQGKKLVYRIGFNPKCNIPTLIPRKRIKRISVYRKIGIKNVKLLDKKDWEKGNCIQVDSPDGLYLVGKKLIPTHNSQQATIDFPAWYLGLHPEKEVITASYSGELAIKFGSETRDLLNSHQYKLIFPNVRLKEDEKSKGYWRTRQGGGYFSAGIGGAITGRGANCLIIDDPIKNREEAESKVFRDNVWNWYRSTARTRLASNGAIIVILTRWHKDDLAGRLLAQEGQDWRVISFPAIATEDEKFRKKGEALWSGRYDLTELNKIKGTLGSYNFDALYQQTPISSESQEFKENWFKYRTIEYVDQLQTRNFLTIDTAMSEKTEADFTGICRNFVDRENNWNVWASRMKLDPRDLINLLFKLHEEDGFEKIGIEKTAYTWGLKPFLEDEQRKRNKFLPIIELSHHQTQKDTRIRGLIPRYENKTIYHVEGQCKDLEAELMDFPKGVHEDIADALAYQLQIAEAPAGYEELKALAVKKQQHGYKHYK